MSGRTSPIRGSTLALAVLGILVLAGAAAWVHAVWAQPGGAARQEQARQLVRNVGLTDLSLLTEARYTRHLSQADLHSAFQDGPGALEHFPAGSLVSPALRHPTAGFAPAPR